MSILEISIFLALFAVFFAFATCVLIYTDESMENKKKLKLHIIASLLFGIGFFFFVYAFAGIITNDIEQNKVSQTYHM